MLESTPALLRGNTGTYVDGLIGVVGLCIEAQIFYHVFLKDGEGSITQRIVEVVENVLSYTLFTSLILGIFIKAYSLLVSVVKEPWVLAVFLVSCVETLDYIAKIFCLFYFVAACSKYLRRLVELPKREVFGLQEWIVLPVQVYAFKAGKGSLFGMSTYNPIETTTLTVPELLDEEARAIRNKCLSVDEVEDEIQHLFYRQDLEELRAQRRTDLNYLGITPPVTHSVGSIHKTSSTNQTQ